ncbi:gamma-glutamyl-gamma-aminobutyrate hydrolase family protein [Streptomyces tsukubensis]|uniref:Gamma-glutamyl-gamma-aminobutyrate hydrolase n=1 Tax=Streptomyces tsukubensis TaxID=83656 RepID=A0A1V4AF83_9ACTN|nr:gamma-glutamyl-gamma-aminobutyrate hydrolase family protein [Streptomyces tsukubensis]OON82231.1 gamma-glutamyl-gamma-aminobutyrate hydrolase [Streptomyces tsukubensis]QFR92722.1 gamma-glutamyl-gamma-aminobutyrate hydrolase family protein [Streptomyces tsukubensis]
MSRPLIGVSTYLEPVARWGHWRLPTALLPAGYPRLVQASGGLAAMLPPDDPSVAASVVERLDAVVIAGGPDVDPARYGAPRDRRTGPPAQERDAWELALIEAALESGTPLLGICRGMQLLNIALGGTLVQHIGGHGERDGAFDEHAVRPVPGTLYAEIVDTVTQVPTHHHQAVDRLARGLVVSAYAEDGTVEAVEPPGGDWVLGVQWHPEMASDTRVMTALVTAAARTPRAMAAGSSGRGGAGLPS